MACALFAPRGAATLNSMVTSWKMPGTLRVNGHGRRGDVGCIPRSWGVAVVASTLSRELPTRLMITRRRSIAVGVFGGHCHATKSSWASRSWLDWDCYCSPSLTSVSCSNWPPSSADRPPARGRVGGGGGGGGGRGGGKMMTKPPSDYWLGSGFWTQRGVGKGALFSKKGPGVFFDEEDERLVVDHGRRRRERRRRGKVCYLPRGAAGDGSGGGGVSSMGSPAGSGREGDSGGGAMDDGFGGRVGGGGVLKGGVFGGGGKGSSTSLDGRRPGISRLLVEYKLSDFDVSRHVGVGLAGKADEAVFEAVVTKPDSPIRGKRVVLRKLSGRRARRWGMRALEVFPRLVRGEDRYHPSTTRLHGYISSPSSSSDVTLKHDPRQENGARKKEGGGGGGGKEEDEEDNEELFLIHGYYGNYSLHQWLLMSDWLPHLEEKLAAGKKLAGDGGVIGGGGRSEVSRKLLLVRMIIRDILISINYLHNNGLAHTSLRLQDIHVSAADRHVKVGLLGNAVDLPPRSDYSSSGGKDPDFSSSSSSSASSSFSSSSSSTSSTWSSSAVNMEAIRRKVMISRDIKCVGVVMARMVLSQLLAEANFAKFRAFLRQGNDPATLREFMLPMIRDVRGRKKRRGGEEWRRSGGMEVEEEEGGEEDHVIGLQILDRDGGAGWSLLGALLAANPSERISCAEALRHPFLCGPRWTTGPSLEFTRWVIGSAAGRIVERYMYLNQQRERLWQLISTLERMNGAGSSWCNQLVRSSLFRPHPPPLPAAHVAAKEGQPNSNSASPAAHSSRLKPPTGSINNSSIPWQWRLAYHTGRLVGLTRRKPSPHVRMGHVMMTISRQQADFAPSSSSSSSSASLSTSSSRGVGLSVEVVARFTIMPESEPWPHDKSGMKGTLRVRSGSCYGFLTTTEAGAGVVGGREKGGGKGGGRVVRGGESTPTLQRPSAIDGYISDGRQKITAVELPVEGQKGLRGDGDGTGYGSERRGEEEEEEESENLRGNQERELAEDAEGERGSSPSVGKESSRRKIDQRRTTSISSRSWLRRRNAPLPSSVRDGLHLNDDDDDDGDGDDANGNGLSPVLRFDFGTNGEDEESISVELDYRGKDVDFMMRILNEVQRQLPMDLFHVSRLACVTYIDNRMLIVRGISGTAMLFLKSTGINSDDGNERRKPSSSSSSSPLSSSE
ncbi:hypothetical protein CBR_g39728 [Chara braunii]|uniref:Protein kinase domain-containing protein n=1 Tax=Chara braunii TaxID=69332 RepID=A0A388LSI6_CHABU|nr:hypothetical protein CBR_g39728 [Chara braunii]|eukprot:GBG85163.1 hypothetical protein CBR_g39728 [Chara braunii]